MTVEIVGRIGIAVGRGLDGVHQRVDAGGGGQMRRQPDGQCRVEQDGIGLERIAPEPDLGMRRRRTAPRCASPPSPCQRWSARRRTARRAGRKRIGAQTVVARGCIGSGNRRHALAEIHGRAAAQRHHGLGALAPRELRGRIGLRHRGVALDAVEHGHRQTRATQRALGASHHAEGLDAGIGYQQHVPGHGTGVASGSRTQAFDERAKLLERPRHPA